MLAPFTPPVRPRRRAAHVPPRRRVTPRGTADLRRVRFFVELARDLHFGRSAVRQHVSQPTLSQQIRRLEEELGVELFVRGGGRVTLSAAGAALLPHARELLAQADRFNALAAGQADADGGSHER
ncbi:LysR family transcriptional regulator [Patulibacter sp. SYSU D01012]|uniref:LysR family transcriptional regulator n=1 Tax=Patulibacter sp. SYSU D01012 TaxID=2817381 RepID=UPI001B3139AE|nr:LysR family transcriptional regulator [Patulibacter sp. SYSU D01012]